MTDSAIVPINPEPEGEFLFYQTEDGKTRVQVRVAEESVWLSLNQMADLFQRDKSVISRHIKNISEEGELLATAVVAKYATTAVDGKTYQVDYYNLNVIIAVGYRVKSHRGTQFRIWATERLSEYLVKGFTMDDERLKQRGGGNYFEELLARIRDIRSSERVFWSKVLDIYASSIDYDPKTETSKLFFKTVQNKMHYAAHGHTAAEIITQRADAEKPHMGLTSWSGDRVGKADISIAKNYLDDEELDLLNRIVTTYLDLAELQALNRRPMYMRDWQSKLDEFLRVSEREILTHAGNISHEDALAHAEAEYEKYRKIAMQQPTPVEEHFWEALAEVKQIENTKQEPAKKQRGRKKA